MFVGNFGSIPTPPAGDVTSKAVNAAFLGAYTLRGDVAQTWSSAYQVSAQATLGLGSMAVQAATAVNIDGGTVDGTVIGSASAAAASFTTISCSATATFSSGAGAVGSINKITLYSTTYGFGISPSSLDYVVPTGASHSFYVNATRIGYFTSTGLNGAAIGATTPSTGAFTTLTASTPTLGDNSTRAATTAFVVASFAQNYLSVVATAAIGASKLVTLSNTPSSATLPSATLADNTVASGAGQASGFATAAIASGATGNVLRAGLLSGLSGLTPGATYYLGTAGGVTITPPSASGTTTQIVGIAASTTTIDVRLGEAEYNE